MEQRRDWPGLLEVGQRWTLAEPDNATAWFVLGRANSELKRFPEAIAAYLQDLRVEPGDVYARNNLGNAYRNSRLYNEAMNAYHDAVRLDPDYIPAWHNLGITFYALKGTAGVARALQRLRSTDPAPPASGCSTSC